MCYQDFQPTSVFSPCCTWFKEEPSLSLLQCNSLWHQFQILFVRPLYQSKPAHKPAHTCGHDAAKERKKPKPEERESSPVPCDGSTTENGVEDKEPDQLNGDKEECRALIQPESAFSSDSKTCNSNPHLNALNVDSGCYRDEGLEAAVLKKEE